MFIHYMGQQGDKIVTYFISHTLYTSILTSAQTLALIVFLKQIWSKYNFITYIKLQTNGYVLEVTQSSLLGKHSGWDERAHKNSVPQPPATRELKKELKSKGNIL